MEESSIQLPEERLDELTTILFEDADTDNSGSISFEELSTELEKHPGVLENLTIRSDTPIFKSNDLHPIEHGYNILFYVVSVLQTG